jgi:hypothetical protein
VLMAMRRYAALGAAVALCALVAGCATTDGHPVSAPTVSTSAAVSSVQAAAPPSSAVPSLPPSDDEQIRAAIKAFSDAANSQNWDAYLQAMCPSMRATFTGPVMDQVKKDRADHGLTTAKVLGVDVTGDTATAQLESTNELIGTQRVSLPLQRGDSGWAICVRSR